MTERQVKILAAIIEQYAEIAVPVGSVTLAKLFAVSSATIRAEMAKLEDMGLIAAPHTSAGRIPTDKGYRVYVNGITDAAMRSEMLVLKIEFTTFDLPACTYRADGTLQFRP